MTEEEQQYIIDVVELARDMWIPLPQKWYDKYEEIMNKKQEVAPVQPE